MALLTEHEIQDLRRTLLRAAPHREDEINALADAALGRTQVQFVEVTYRNGDRRVMSADEYTRLTALDLLHTDLRWLTAAEAGRRGRA